MYADLGGDACDEQFLSARRFDSFVEALVMHGVDDAGAPNASRVFFRQDFLQFEISGP